ncbi:MAG: hypothetical protein CVT77_01365 [Alphaproteobacteria bacterium HGW-Alphaproteobacteria-16]|nr:MAG: hypothetical protein CVT77_01365 [Alphaproteobacteria bacterium HGW-Alphaproteobacteria-16]
MAIIAHSSSRPRYAFMVLNLIAEVAGPDGSAGPWIEQDGQSVLLRDWLCDALVPMGHRDPRRIALGERVRSAFEDSGTLPASSADADRAIEDEVRARVRAAGKSNLSRAVSDLVRVGLLRRHYQGFRVDHHNRGAQRQAVYTLAPVTRRLLSRAVEPIMRPPAVQQQLPL